MPTALAIVQKFFPEVTSVKDANKDAHVEVTNRDSSSATVRNHKGCAMAVACKRKMALDGVIISVKTAYMIKGDQATRYKLPESVSREVISFDRKGGFAAGEYKMLKPNGNQKLGIVKLGGGNGKKTGTSKAIEPKHLTEGIRTVLGSKATHD